MVLAIRARGRDHRYVLAPLNIREAILISQRTYWPSGSIKTIIAPGMPTLYYGASDGSGLDGEGRMTKVTASSGQNPVTGGDLFRNRNPGWGPDAGRVRIGGFGQLHSGLAKQVESTNTKE